MTHPLTDEMCYQMSLENWGMGLSNDNMRAAADWQLEQVIDWIRENLYWVEEDGSIRYLSGECVTIDHHQIIDDLKKAMRPQEES